MMNRIILAGAVLAATAAAVPADSVPKEQIGWLGVHTETLTEPMLVALDIEHGVIVTDVIEGSPAAAAGIKVGDVLMKIDEERISSSSELRAAVRSRPGRSVRISLRRRSRERVVNLKLGERSRAEVMPEAGFDWPGVSLEAMRSARQLLRDAGSSATTLGLAASAEVLDSLRAELEEVRAELQELRRRLGEDR